MATPTFRNYADIDIRYLPGVLATEGWRRGANEHVNFWDRLRDSSLEQKSIRELHWRAQVRGLDIVGLTYHWQYVHILVESLIPEDFDLKHRKFRPDPTRVSFLDLPGEIRNRIYHYALVAAEGKPLEEEYLECFRRLSIRRTRAETSIYGYKEVDMNLEARIYRYRQASPDTRAVCNALERLKWINHAIRDEARSYFYTHNVFLIYDSRTDQGLSRSFLHSLPDHVKMKMETLRASLSLRWYNSQMDLFEQISTHVGLKTLVLDFPLYWLFADPVYTELEDFLYGQRHLPQWILSRYALEALRKLESLEQFTVQCLDKIVGFCGNRSGNNALKERFEHSVELQLGRAIPDINFKVRYCDCMRDVEDWEATRLAAED